MAKEDPMEFDGVVTEVGRSAIFTVKVDEPAGHTIIATINGKMRSHNIKVLLGDRVKVETSPYDLSRGRIVLRVR
jgi:translation initiation factor IF-1